MAGAIGFEQMEQQMAQGGAGAAGVVNPQHELPPHGGDAEVVHQDAQEQGGGQVYRLMGTVDWSNLDVDVGADKEGVLSASAANDLLLLIYRNLTGSDQVSIDNLTVQQRLGVSAAIYAYLALNTNSASGEDGFAPGPEPPQLRWGGNSLAGHALRTLFGDQTARFMRAKATEIRDFIKYQFELEKRFTRQQRVHVHDFCHLMRVVAMKRGLSAHPEYSFVGAEYAAGIPVRMASLVMQSSANVLGTREHVRDRAQDTIYQANRAIRT